jgi:hypothetical protein
MSREVGSPTIQCGVPLPNRRERKKRPRRLLASKLFLTDREMRFVRRFVNDAWQICHFAIDSAGFSTILF